MGAATTTLTREQLYEMVWAKPGTEVAKELGVSDVAVLKACIRLGVPRPSRGYWARIQVGHCLPQTPLSPLRNGQQSFTTFGEWKAARKANQESQARVVSIAKASENRPVHKVVVSTRAAFRGGRIDPKYGRYYPEEGIPHFAIYVSSASFERGLTFLNRLFWALEEAGFYVALNEKRGSRAILINKTTGIELHADLYEAADRYDRVPEKKEIRSNWRSVKECFRPSGRLRFTVVASSHNRRSWSDSDINMVEDRIIQIVAECSAIALEERRRRVAQEEAHRLWEVKQRRLKEEAARQAVEAAQQKEFKDFAENWHQSQRLRAFRDACEARLRAKYSGSLDEAAKQWLAWSESLINQLDPLCRGYPRLDAPPSKG